MWKRQKGFTLLELLVTLTVASILIGIAVPSLTTMLVNHRSQGIGEELINAFSYARSEAVKRSARVSICSSNNRTSCTGQVNWQTGFIVYLDSSASDTSNVTGINSANDVLKVWDSTDPNTIISVKRNNVDVGFVRFAGMGELTRNDPNTVVVSSRVQGCKGANGRTLNINFAGQIRTSKFTCP